VTRNRTPSCLSPPKSLTAGVSQHGTLERAPNPVVIQSCCQNRTFVAFVAEAHAAWLTFDVPLDLAVVLQAQSLVQLLQDQSQLAYLSRAGQRHLLHGHIHPGQPGCGDQKIIIIRAWARLLKSSFFSTKWIAFLRALSCSKDFVAHLPGLVKNLIFWGFHNRRTQNGSKAPPNKQRFVLLSPTSLNFGRNI